MTTSITTTLPIVPVLASDTPANPGVYARGKLFSYFDSGSWYEDAETPKKALKAFKKKRLASQQYEDWSGLTVNPFSINPDSIWRIGAAPQEDGVRQVSFDPWKGGGAEILFSHYSRPAGWTEPVKAKKLYKLTDPAKLRELPRSQSAVTYYR